MSYIAGVDIGNSTTEVCIGEITGTQDVRFLASASRPTTGTKGTLANVHGIQSALLEATDLAGIPMSALSVVRLNEAAPVIGDTAMETLTETIITDSSMIGHNPNTPAGAGHAVGELLLYDRIARAQRGVPYILAASKKISYEILAGVVNALVEDGFVINGIILQADEAVLVENRLQKKIPIIDEVAGIDKLPDGVQTAIEVALPGQTIRMLSNPYGIATLLKLSAEETRAVTPIAKSLIGKRSAVVLKTPGGNVRENVLPAGEIYFHGEHPSSVNLDKGAERIMQAVAEAGEICLPEAERVWVSWIRHRSRISTSRISWRWIHWHLCGFWVRWPERLALRRRLALRPWSRPRSFLCRRSLRALGRSLARR